MPRLIFVNRFFYPDHSATSQLLSDLAFHLAGAGSDVHVVTSTQIYDDPKASLPAHEIVRGVHVHRVSSTRFGRAALLGRSLDYLSFYRSVWRCLIDVARQGDIIVAKTDPPLVSVVAMAAAGRKGARLINWLQDIFPETAAELGVPLMRGPLAVSLAALRNRSLKRAEATVVIGELMRQKVEALGTPAERVHVIPNWCNDEDIESIAANGNPLRQAWGLEGKFVVGYSGNLGRVHEFETMLTAAERLRGDSRFVFLMVGGGKRFDELAGIVRQQGLEGSFRFIPYQERKMLAYSLGAPDVHWLSLNPRLEGLIVPSKFYGIAAAGKPVIAVAEKEGEIARLVKQHACGVVIQPGDTQTLVDALLRMATEPEWTAGMGARARKMLDAQFTRRRALERWDELLDQLDPLRRSAGESTSRVNSFEQ
jgi:glycosyltransferase involved in cell wall biosynthesis